MAASIAALPNLTLRGLMCLPKPASGFEEQRKPFRALSELATELARLHPQLDTLSMGMSGDMAAAIHEGATMLRIGTAIFGQRD